MSDEKLNHRLKGLDRLKDKFMEHHKLSKTKQIASGIFSLAELALIHDVKDDPDNRTPEEIATYCLKKAIEMYQEEI